ncbi:MAG TPA: hypothetical protein VIH57_14425, partial [Bacteroidales bacterium]
MKPIAFIFLLFFFPLVCISQSPVIKVDFNKDGRQESEVNEPGYTPWPISTAASASDTIQGVIITVTGLNLDYTPSTIASNWYK